MTARLTPGRSWDRSARIAAVGACTGLLGGMAAFVYGRGAVAPESVSIVLMLPVIGIAGLYARLWAPDLLGSFFAVIAGLAAGVATLVLSWVVPSYVVEGYAGGGTEWALLGVGVFLTLFLGGYAAGVVYDLFGS